MACCAVLVVVLLCLISAVHAAPQLLAAAGPGRSPPPPPPRNPSVGCQRTCGGVDIPFPFGYGPDHCKLSRAFYIECRDTGNGTFKPFLLSKAEVINISLSSGQIRVFNKVSSYCYNNSTGNMHYQERGWNLKKTRFTFSDTDNKFVAVGCRTVAYIGDSKNESAATYKTGCISMCRPDDLTALKNGTCSGMGCCQTAIPSGLQYNKVWFDVTLSASRGPCSYAALMDESSFNFSTSYVTSSELKNRHVPVVLDWTVGSDNCSVAFRKPGYACASSKSRCIDAAGGRGYICNCTQGFEGNPYLVDGCQDIDECKDPKYPCFGECINTNGNFTCSCPLGTQGDPTIKGQCKKDPFPRGARIAVGISTVVLVLLVAFLATQVFLKKRSNKIQGYFEQHGGQVLSNVLKAKGMVFTFFNRGDIVKATRSFRKANIIGEGAHGAVYKGVISVRGTATTVAVKRCNKKIDETRTREFVQELVILSQVNHPNIVRLLGCCLHFEAPVLVFEFVQNGTLNDLLHGKQRQHMTLSTRLRIITETAEALAYLHSPPQVTLHGDVKPENILLGENLVAKVTDFGCSTIYDNVQVVPKGTVDYLDPEFLTNPQITDKTDVHSLGVVLMELLTGKKPLVKGQKNLRIVFQEATVNGTLNELLDADVIKEEGAIGVIRQVAELASRCTAIPGKTRPSMAHVAEELRRLSNEVPEHSQALQAVEGPGR